MNQKILKMLLLSLHGSLETGKMKKPCYWFKTGLFQKQYDSFCKRLDEHGCSGAKHERLFHVMRRIYYGVHNNGDCNWYMLIENKSFNLAYKVPEDAFDEIRDFFDKAESCQHFTPCEDEDDYHRDFTEDQVEEVFDKVIEYAMLEEINMIEDDEDWKDVEL